MKLLFAALLSLAGVGLGTGPASAGLFCHHCCKSCATICVKPYNAFSPSVFGSVRADGCFPLSCARPRAGLPAVGGPPGPPPWFGGPGCAMDGCGAPAHGTAAATMNPPARGTPTMLPGAGGVPTFQAPAPSQVPAGAPAGAQVGMPGVQPTGYAPPPWMQPPTYPVYWGNPNGR